MGLLYALDAIVPLMSFLIRARCDEYKGYLKSQGYKADLVDNQFDRALSIERSELLKKNVKPDKRVFPSVLDYNPIQSNPYKSIFPVCHRTKNLKDILAPSKFCVDSGVNQAERATGGYFKCSSRCDLYKSFLIQDSKFKKLFHRPNL